MTFDEWYATQKHQLANEQVCRMVWEAAAREENKNLREQVAHLSLYKPARRTEQQQEPVKAIGPCNNVFWGIVETDEEFEERAGTKIAEEGNA